MNKPPEHDQQAAHRKWEQCFNRGIDNHKKGNHEKAIADFNEAIKLKPDHPNVYHNRGAAKSNLGWHKKAIVDFNEAIRLKPDDTAAYYNRGNAKSNLGKHKEAIADYSEAIKLNPDLLKENYNNWSSAAEAIAYLNETIRLKPDNANAYYYRGLANKNIGRTRAALADFRQALKMCSNNKEMAKLITEAKNTAIANVVCVTLGYVVICAFAVVAVEEIFSPRLGNIFWPILALCTCMVILKFLRENKE